MYKNTEIETAYHEAGHVVIAESYGYKVTQVRIKNEYGKSAIYYDSDNELYKELIDVQCDILNKYGTFQSNTVFMHKYTRLIELLFAGIISEYLYKLKFESQNLDKKIMIRVLKNSMDGIIIFDRLAKIPIAIGENALIDKVIQKLIENKERIDSLVESEFEEINQKTA